MYKNEYPFYPVGQKQTVEFISPAEKHDWKRYKKAFTLDWYYNQHKVFYEINELGYRCKYTYPPEQDYILVAGCSHTFGHSVRQEHRYSDLLENKLNKPVLNIGVSGGSCNLVKDNLLQLIASGYTLPKAIIVQWPEENRLWLDQLPITASSGIAPELLKGDTIKNISSHAFNTTLKLCEKFNMIHIGWKVHDHNSFDIPKLGMVDTGRDGHHPGIESHNYYYQHLITKLEENGIQ